MVQRSLTLLALTSFLGCTGDPTGDLAGGPDHLEATPSAVYVGNATVKSVVVASVDDAGNQVEDNFTLSAADIGPNITVVRDSTFDLVRNTKGELVLNPHPTHVRYNVTTTVFVESEFTVRAGSRSVTIPVRTQPVALTGPISNLTPALGDTVTITAPPGLSFDPAASVVTFSGVATFLVSRSATEIKFVPQPAAGGQATVSNVLTNYAAGPTYAVPTQQNFIVPPIPLLNASAVGLRAIGDSVTITIPAPFKWGRGTGAAASVLTSTGGTLSTPSISADSSTVKFQIGPNATDTLRISNLRIAGTTLTGFPAKAQAATTTPVVTNFAGTFSSATPAVNDTVVLTAPANFRFLPTATVTLGTNNLFRVGVSADSTQLRFVPSPATAASTATVTGIVFSTLRSVPLTLPTVATVTPPALGTPLAGAGAFATAPTITFPASGQSKVFFDFGALSPVDECVDGAGGPCRLYKFTLAASTTFTISEAWQGTTDMGLYFFNSAQVLLGGACDALGNGTGGQPETCTNKTLAAGTYYVGTVDFGAFYSPVPLPPTWQRFRIAVN